MKERPILFSGPMVRALLDGSKTQTRREIKPRKDHTLGCELAPCELAGEVNNDDYRNCPYGAPGDRFWVRESFSYLESFDFFSKNVPDDVPGFWYWADGDPTWGDWTRPKPSIHMPRLASRITLDLVDVRAQRLQNISEADCRAEGCAGGHGSIPGYSYNATPQEHFQSVWESVGGNFDANPWVWVLEFQRITA